MRMVKLGVWTGLLASCVLCGQNAASSLRFDAGSVKEATIPVGARLVDGRLAIPRLDGKGVSVLGNSGGPGTDDPGRIHYPAIALKDLLTEVYDSFVEIRGPGWLDSDLIQVDAVQRDASKPD